MATACGQRIKALAHAFAPVVSSPPTLTLPHEYVGEGIRRRKSAYLADWLAAAWAELGAGRYFMAAVRAELLGRGRLAGLDCP